MRGVCVLAFVCGCAQGAGTDDTQPAATGGPGGTLGGGDGSWASSDAPSGSDPDTGTSFDSGTDAEVLKPAYLPDGRTYDQDFVNLESFNVQAASTDDPSAGTVTVEACDQVIASVLLQVGSSGVPGFNNFPVPAWPVPTADDCIWRIHATGGYVDVRAVTVEHRSSGPENPI
jgi:hypothetical protein